MSLIANIANPNCCTDPRNLCPRCESQVMTTNHLPLPEGYPNRCDGHPTLVANGESLPLPNTIETLVNERRTAVQQPTTHEEEEGLPLPRMEFN